MKKIFYLFLFLGQTIFAQKIYTVNQIVGQNLNGFIETFDDTTFKLNILDVKTIQKSGVFKPLNGTEIKKSHSIANHWVHFRLNSKENRSLILELDNPRLNEISFYKIFGDSIVNQVHTGDSKLFNTRAIANKNWLFPIEIDEKTIDIYLMLNKKYEALSTNIALFEAAQYNILSQKIYFYWGILLGLTCFVLLLNIFIWYATNDKIFGWFMLIIFMNAFHISAATGLGFQYIWSDFPNFNSFYPQTFSTWLVIAFQLIFMQLFIGQTAQNSRVYKVVKIFTKSIFLLFIVFATILYFGLIEKQYFQIMLIISLIINFLIIPLSLISIFERIQKREKIILFFTVVSVFKTIVLFIYLANLILKFTKFDSLDVVLCNFLFDLIVLSIGVIYFGFSKYRHQNELLLTTLHASEQAQSKKIIEALEIERNRIAEDLYDDVGAMLSTAINYQSSILRKVENKEKFPILVESRKLLDRAVENLRTVSHNLMPKNFATIGLSKSIEETINKIGQNSEISFYYQQIGVEKKLGAAKEVQIFRIAAELISDILRNSEATNATIQLIYGKENLILMAEDDRGIEPINNNLASKVDFIDAKLNIDFGVNGLTIIVEIPY